MSTSLLDTASQYLTPDLVQRLAAFTGESPAAAATAVRGAAPAVLAGMLHAAQDGDGLTRLVNLFQQGRFDGSMLDNVAGSASGNAMDGLMKTGGPLLGSLFGARSSGLVDLLARFAGIKKSSAMSLLSVVAPLVMSVMGRQLASQGGVNPGNLKNLLVSQRDAIVAAAPPGLGRLLGIGDLPDAARAGTPGPAASADSRVRRLLPILIAVVALLLLFTLLRTCGNSPATSTPPRDTLNTMAPDTGAPTAAGADPTSTTDAAMPAASGAPAVGGVSSGEGSSGQAP